MSRYLCFAVLAVAMGGLWLLPRPDSVRLAATQAGMLLRESARPGPVAVGVDSPGGAPESSDLTPAPFWRSLTEGAGTQSPDGAIEVRVRGYRIDLSGSPWRDHRLHSRFFESVQRSLRAIAAEEGFEVTFKEKSRTDFDGVLLYCFPRDGQLSLEAHLPDGSVVHTRKEWHAPGPLSLFPSVLAILIAVLFRRPLLALGSGVLVGAVLERTMRGVSWLDGLGLGAGRLASRYFANELLEPTRQQIVLFIVLMMAMVGVITRAGGVRGLMERLAHLVRSARGSQAASFLMGLVVFFDHYANAVLVGSTMRPLTDRFKIAREKLAYLVDSTAAPVAGLSIFSTWIAFEVSTFSVQLPEAGMAASQGYEVFLRTLPYRFYSLFTLFFVGLIVLSGRDFGPMLRAERRARSGKLLAPGARLLVSSRRVDLEPDAAVVARARTALLPLLAMILTTLASVMIRGGASAGERASLLSFEGWLGVVLQGSGSLPLMWGALAGLAVACVQARALGLDRGIVQAAWIGVRPASVALAMLLFAWMIGAICRDMGTPAYLAVILQESLNPLLLPILLFVIAGLIALATGSSWSTMTILLPLVVSVAYEAGQSTPIGGEGMLVVAIAAILEGAIFGDHCSPISDTTVMSSIATASDHIDHVRTQAPYAALTMVIALVCGYYPAVILGLSPALSLLMGASVLTGFLFYYGRRSESRGSPWQVGMGVPSLEG